MAVQQRISRELNEELVGQELDVMIDGVSEESELVLVGRHQGQAPEVDGVGVSGHARECAAPGGSCQGPHRGSAHL